MSGHLVKIRSAHAMKNQPRKRRFVRTKPHASVGRIEFEFAFARLSARIYLGTVRDIEDDLKKAEMTPNMPPNGAALVARAHVFLAHDTTEQALADLELIDSVGRYYLRRRAQKRNAARKSGLPRIGKIQSSNRRSVMSRKKMKRRLRGANQK